MSAQPFNPIENVRVLADGTIEDGHTRIRPWPFLGMQPRRTLVRTQEIIWAQPGDQLWPFTRKIPPALLALVRTAPGNSWELLELAAAAPERGCELIRQCPALAIMIARSCPNNCDRPANHYGRLLDCTWRQMLAEVGLPPKRNFVRLLRKLPLSHCHERALATLHAAIRDGQRHLHVLAHLSQLTRDTIALLALPPGLVNSHLLIGSMKSPPDATPIAWCVESVSWLREMETPGADWPYGQLRPHELDRVEARLRARLADDFDHLAPFPPPPLPGLPGLIAPLRNYWELVAEGHQQNNCARFYREEIFAGDCYVYAVTGAERATLLLRRNLESNQWFIGDLRTEGNQAVQPGTWRRVKAWLQESSIRCSITT